MDLKTVIRDIPDFPKPGILFRDITPVLDDADAFRTALDGLSALVRPLAPTRLAAIEARGFLFAAPLAREMGLGLTILRKPGKLPGDTIAASYALEYGEATLEVHRDSVAAGDRIVVMDDLLATGGTAAAAGDLVRKLGATVAAYVFLVELADLGGRRKLGEDPVFSLVNYS